LKNQIAQDKHTPNYQSNCPPTGLDGCEKFL